MRSTLILQSILAGFLATCVMMLAMYMTLRIGLRQMDLATLFSALLTRQWPAPYSWYWWLGVGLYGIAYSVIFPLLYVYLFAWLASLWWGVILWLLAETVFMPIAGQGFFGTTQPFLLVLAVGSLVLHLIYGAVWSIVHGGTTSHHLQAEL